MKNRIATWMRMLFYENDELSLTRLITGIGFLAFLAVTFYLVCERFAWQNYDTFACLTGGGSAANQLVNKFINSKYNSMPGSYSQMGGVKK